MPEKFIIVSMDRIYKKCVSAADARAWIANWKAEVEASTKPGDAPRSVVLVVARVVAGESKRFTTRATVTTEETPIEVE